MREHNLSTFATRFGSDFYGTIEEKSRQYSYVEVFSIEARSKMARREDWMRNVQVIFSQVLTPEERIRSLTLFSWVGILLLVVPQAKEGKHRDSHRVTISACLDDPGGSSRARRHFQEC